MTNQMVKNFTGLIFDFKPCFYGRSHQFYKVSMKTKFIPTIMHDAL